MRRAAATVVSLVAVIGAIGLAVHLSSSRLPTQHQPTQHQPIEDNRPQLRKLITEQEAESAQAVARYEPKTVAQITDLDSPATDLLLALPGVVQVEVLAKADKPTSRIIHLRDWHHVPKELFALDMAQAHGRSLSQDEIDRLYKEHLLEVELVQVEQMAVLRCLIKNHGLKRVFSEGYDPTEVDVYREKIAVLRAMENEQIPELRRQLADVRQLFHGANKEKAKAIEAEIVGMLDQHKHRLLEMGAAGRLLISGELEDVLPLEDAAAIEKARPITPSGKVESDPKKIEARNDAQVRAAMKERPVAVIILGGGHDLTRSIQRLGGDCEYLRVTTKRYREIGE